MNDVYLNEILTGFYLALNGKGYTVYKQYTTGNEKRICIVNKGVRPTDSEQLQEASVWVECFAPNIANLPDISTLQSMKTTVETNLGTSITVNGQTAYLKEVNVLGPVIDPQVPNEAFIILAYDVIVR